MDPSWWSPLVTLVALAIPSTFALAALAPVSAEAATRRAARVCAVALGLALVVAAAVALGPPVTEAPLGARVDRVTVLALVLVTGLGLAVARYSQRALAGEPGLARYARSLAATLAAVTTLASSGHLGVIAAAWTATSLALHELLTFYPERAAARRAAREKFLVSRLADVCMLAALALVHREVGSLELSRVLGWAEARPALSPSMHAAAVLVALAVAARSAQLPLHGWLTRVMEAPTPVSALLHAGVVNLGGLLLVRLAPWLTHAGPARWLLLTIGLSSVVVGALMMATRPSVKVALAWSTSAQLGFMLVECALGAWSLALLHLVAHSLYKAHAFLSAGSAVEHARARALSPPSAAPSWARLAVAALFALALGPATLALAGRALGAPLDAGLDVRALVLAGLAALSLVPWAARRSQAAGPRLTAAAAAGGVLALGGGVALAYLAAHAAAARLFALEAPPASADAWLWPFVGATLVGLFWLRAALERAPEGRLARLAYPVAHAGLSLDERVSRLARRLWPLERAPAPRGGAEVRVDAVEVRA
jgi:NAD(P)H-quinone oxidoreductase subunit 5